MDGGCKRHEFPAPPIINITSYFATSGHPDSTVDYFEGFWKVYDFTFTLSLNAIRL